MLDLSKADRLGEIKSKLRSMVLDLSGIHVGDDTATFTELGAPTRYEQNNPLLEFSGPWSTYASSTYSGGSYTYTRTTGSTITVHFNGTAIDYIACTSLSQGLAQITLDGQVVATVNLYSSSFTPQVRVWGTSGLSSADHTLVITNVSTRYVNLDAFDIVGTLIAAP